MFCYVDRYFVILFRLLHFLFQRDLVSFHWFLNMTSFHRNRYTQIIYIKSNHRSYHICVYAVYVLMYAYTYMYICARYWATQNYRKGNSFTATALLIHWCAMQDHQGIAQHALDVHVVGFLASRLWTRIAMPKKEFGCLYYTGCCCFTAVIWDERWPSVLRHEEELSGVLVPADVCFGLGFLQVFVRKKT